MTVSKTDVLYALLALDAYHRSDDPLLRAIGEADKSAIATTIGAATWVNSSDRMSDTSLAGSTDSGFSASYYTLDGKTVLSYRGTDFPSSLSWFSISEFLKDFSTGWLTSISVLNPDGFDPFQTGTSLVNYQPYYAKAF